MMDILLVANKVCRIASSRDKPVDGGVLQSHVTDTCSYKPEVIQGP